MVLDGSEAEPAYHLVQVPLTGLSLLTVSKQEAYLRRLSAAHAAGGALSCPKAGSSLRVTREVDDFRIACRLRG